MQQKLKRIKKRPYSDGREQRNGEGNQDKCVYGKLDHKMKSSIGANGTQSNKERLILPNWLEKPQAKCSNNDTNNKNKNNTHSNSNSNSNWDSSSASVTSFKTHINYRQLQSSIQCQHHSRNQQSRTTTTPQWRWPTLAFKSLPTNWSRQPGWQLLLLGIFLLGIQCDKVRYAEAGSLYDSTTPMQLNTESTATPAELSTDATWSTPHTNNNGNNGNKMWQEESTTTSYEGHASNQSNEASGDSIFMRFARRFSTGNELWDGIIRDCYRSPSFTCFQSNVYTYLNTALDTGDVNVTQRLKFFKNNVNYVEPAEEEDDVETPKMSPTRATTDVDIDNDDEGENKSNETMDEHLLHNEIPLEIGRAAHEPASPIEEVTTALYGKSIKFAMTHDIEIQLPEMLFDGATFRISPRGFEGNGIIAKLELIPKQEIQARLAGKILMNKIKKFFQNKLLLSFLALVLIIKIIKIKLFWLLPLIVGVGAAKKLLLKFLLFLFPALSHLFKLCSYYQQTYHSTKYHHHHHLIDHHHTIVPPWHNEAHHTVPEIIYTSPPKGHISAYLHGAPIHETYGPPPHEHNEGNWDHSGPGLGSEYIADVNRAAQIEENTNFFKPNANDGNEIQAWGLGPPNQNQQRPQPQYSPQTQQQRPPSQQQQQQQNSQNRLQIQTHIQQQQQPHQKPHSTSHSFNPFGVNAEKQQSVFTSKYKIPFPAQSAPRPVYTPSRAGSGGGGNPAQHAPHQTAEPNGAATIAGLNNGVVGFGSNAAQIVAQYEPARHNSAQQTQQQHHQQHQQQQQEPISPELAAQLKEALRIQAEQRIIAQQQKILEAEPFVQDGQPLYPKNYDPFYSPILLKIDKIVEQLGITDELCKERLICSMYKDPTRYSPHSNFVSAELSRDTSELQPVTSTNPAVIRFYRLIQAARDGQDQRDCLRLYAQCNINTE